MRSMSGFTLIELIMVVVILGVLSAIAIPRFASLGEDAAEAARAGILASTRSAATITYSACQANNSCNSSLASSSIDLAGKTVATTFGYPAALSGGLNNAIDLHNSITPSYTPNTVTLTDNNTSCTVIYTEPASAGTPPTYAGSC